MRNITAFDRQLHHLYIPVFLNTPDGERHELDAVLDTGAPLSEFSDQFLQYVGLIKKAKKEITLKSGLETQRYGKIVLPPIEICGHNIQNIQVCVSHFDKHWGVDALIGLDFFRQFRVTIDYKEGWIITEPLAGEIE